MREDGWCGNGEKNSGMWEVLKREIRKLANRQPQGRKETLLLFCIEEKVLSFSKTLSTSDLTFTYCYNPSVYLLIVFGHTVQLRDLGSST